MTIVKTAVPVARKTLSVATVAKTLPSGAVAKPGAAAVVSVVPVAVRAIKPRGLSATARIMVSTTQSQAVWFGRSASTANPNGRTSIPLAMALLRLPYDLTAKDNPLADAVLLHLEDGLERLRGDCQLRIVTVLDLLAERQKMGVTTPIVTARDPIELECAFGTPYHYMLVDALALYDSAVRHLLTVSMTGLLSSSQVRVIILGLTKDFARLLYDLVKMTSTLRKTSSEVSRTSLLADATHQKLLEDWEAAYGAVSEKVLSGLNRPTHTRAPSWSATP